MKLDQLKKKLFNKKPPAPPEKPRRDPNLRHSRSMPLRSSDDTEESYMRPRPVHRGADAVLDISVAAQTHYERRRCAHPDVPEDVDEALDYVQRLVDGDIVDQFPMPPGHNKPLPPINNKPTRPSTRPPTQNFDLPGFHSSDILPPPDTVTRGTIDHMYTASKAKYQAENHKPAYRSPVVPFIHRSTSNSSTYARPAGSNRPSPGTARDRAQAMRNNHIPSSSVSTPYTGGGAGKPYSPATSKRYGLDLNNLYGVPAAVAGLYTNPDATISSQSLGPNAYFRAPPVPSRSPEILNPSEPAGGPDSGPATVRRRNASAASSRSAHSARRNMMAPGGTPYWDPSMSTPERQQQTYHPDVMRVARGPHAAKLQSPSPIKPLRHRDGNMPLSVNDTDGREWGAATSKPGYHGPVHHPATVAGQGRAGLALRTRGNRF